MEKLNIQWFTYFVKCSDGSLYAGVTTDIEKRLNQHNGIINGGAKYTQGKRPVTLAYLEKNDNRSEAQKREYIIRKLPIKKKKELVSSFSKSNSLLH